MAAKSKKDEFVTFSPRLRADDESANYWMRQVTARLRREICWCWHERGVQPVENLVVLPPFVEKLPVVLDQSRFWEDKKKFYRSDPTARYLTDKLEAAPPRATARAAQGSFSWLGQKLQLDEIASFVLALALTTVFDSSMGSVIAACLNDPAKTYPNLALAQRLWDEPSQVLLMADPLHPLFRCGVLKHSASSKHHYAETEWDMPLTVPSLVANQLLFPATPFPHGLLSQALTSKGEEELTDAARLVALRLSSDKSESLRIVPLLGPRGSRHGDTARAIARSTRKELIEYRGHSALTENASHLDSLATLSWLKDAALFISREATTASADKQRAEQNALPSSSIPATLFLAVTERSQLAHIAPDLLLPIVRVPQLSYQERIAYWKKALGAKAKGLDAVIAENSRRFRYEKESIDAISAGLKGLPGPVTKEDFVAACRAEMDLDIGELASRVTPRFGGEELILPHKQDLQFQEHVKAMHSLTEVHYGWGTAKVWNESGISVLFAGPPGTGKTMAAEILAIRLDLPMYRIDLSQVVNKYIGETEKNLKRLFDAADVSDIILFFDEADSLFGRRTEVSDAHDRYANLEISYLLERMERFKGLAILATNRKKDLDEAFLRRLRYIIDFPLPDVDERKRIWQQVIPTGADASQLDFDFLSRQFQLAGGNIRSIIFNACLQCADDQKQRKGAARGRLSMHEVIVAIKREYDKLNRTMSPEQFGPYAEAVIALEHEQKRHQD